VASNELYLEISTDHPVPASDEGPDSQCSVTLGLTSDEHEARIAAVRYEDRDDESAWPEEKEMWLEEDYATFRAIIGQAFASQFVCLVNPHGPDGPHPGPNTRVTSLSEFDAAVREIRISEPAEHGILRTWVVPADTEAHAAAVIAEYRASGSSDGWHAVLAAGVVLVDTCYQGLDVFARAGGFDRIRSWVESAASVSARRVVWSPE
jgi:hypothetical protein